MNGSHLFLLLLSPLPSIPPPYCFPFPASLLVPKEFTIELWGQRET